MLTRNRILLALVLIGLALRLWFVAVNVIDPRYSAADDGDYYQRALHFAATGDYVDNSWLIRPPLHVLMDSVLLWISITIGQTAIGIPLIRAVQIALSLLTIPIGYGLARRLFGERPGYTFAALMAIWFPMIELPALILSEPLFFFFLLLHLYLLVRWRDERATNPRAWLLLAGAGVTLGLSALARSPALYASAFVVGWLVLEAFGERRKTKDERRNPARAQMRSPSQAVSLMHTRPAFLPSSFVFRLSSSLAARWSLIFLSALALAIAPWAIRNYIAYHQFIPTDTLGPVNLWLALTSVGGEGKGKAILASLPQAERQSYVTQQIWETIKQNPAILLRNFEPHFRHIWKAQFIEDFLVKASFYTRPLRAIWPLGILSDLLWFVFTIGGLLALAAPLRFKTRDTRHEVEVSHLPSPVSRLPSGDGPFRWLALGWIGYSALIVMLMHIEPRYLLPIWLLMALYGAWAVGDWHSLWDALRRRPLNGVLAVALVVTFLFLFFTYRDYPDTIARGLQREQHIAAGQRAYTSGDYPTAEREFGAAIAQQPGFIDGRTDLALTLVAQNRYDDALVALSNGDTHRANVVRGAIARAQGKNELAATYFNNAEIFAGEDVQALTLDWLRPPATSHLTLGDGLDFGYVQGFSNGEKLGEGNSTFTYRWLEGDGRVVLPLATPLRANSIVLLRLAGGPGASTPLDVTIGGQSAKLNVLNGQWRTYRLAVPPALTGQQRIDISLHAPTFIPAHVDTNSDDTRPLSLMVSTVEVQ